MIVKEPFGWEPPFIPQETIIILKPSLEYNKHVYTYLAPLQQGECDTRKILKGSATGLNSEFSFF